ncbi:DUF983 domain-containing protein [Phaeovulum sp. NW3]|uniref:DUF983 domain-containing protein n=1 Tax=Phaeovulum sp. NW3 TaxID=2934933 RepID=UPI00202060E9|nr:DUF983 domain-containing protein [Phaeovulum sp. NW3]MCL7463483.1 DUF983 domain-containing protein [Phaeovulum sp. NW3]
MAATDTDLEDDRPMGPAVLRGLMCRCPACGKGRVLQGYLRVRDECPACHEVFSHHRADDGPAYLTILIVGHLMAPLLMWAFVTFRPDPMTMIAIFATGCVVLSLALLPVFKGMIVAIQWSRRMHGFGAEPAGAADV